MGDELKVSEPESGHCKRNGQNNVFNSFYRSRVNHMNVLTTVTIAND